MSGTLVIGIGNALGGDDAAGPCLVRMLNRKRQRTSNSSVEITTIDAATAPESYTSVIRRQRPDLLILVDAADMGLPPGALRIIPPGNISVLSFSTHHMPLSTFLSYVKDFCGTVMLIGVQPQQTDMGDHISTVVRKSMMELVEAIIEDRVAEIPLLS
jgi:hydrogenase 3 maturation protease